MLAQLRAIGKMDVRLFGTQAQRKRWLRHKVWNRLPPLIRPLFYFFYRFVLTGGFLDGRDAFAYHFLQALWYPMLIDVKYLELLAKDRLPVCLNNQEEVSRTWDDLEVSAVSTCSVTGATSPVGRQLVDKLLAAGYVVHAIGRGRATPDLGPSWVWHQCDLTRTGRLSPFLRARALPHRFDLVVA